MVNKQTKADKLLLSTLDIFGHYCQTRISFVNRIKHCGEQYKRVEQGDQALLNKTVKQTDQTNWHTNKQTLTVQTMQMDVQTNADQTNEQTNNHSNVELDKQNPGLCEQTITGKHSL